MTSSWLIIASSFSCSFNLFILFIDRKTALLHLLRRQQVRRREREADQKSRRREEKRIEGKRKGEGKGRGEDQQNAISVYYSFRTTLTRVTGSNIDRGRPGSVWHSVKAPPHEDTTPIGLRPVSSVTPSSHLSGGGVTSCLSNLPPLSSEAEKSRPVVPAPMRNASPPPQSYSPRAGSPSGMKRRVQ